MGQGRGRTVALRDAANWRVPKPSRPARAIVGRRRPAARSPLRRISRARASLVGTYTSEPWSCPPAARA